MDNIQFSEEQSLPNQNTYSPVKKSVFANKLISWGIAKDEKTANLILVIFAVACLLLSFYIFARTLGIGQGGPGSVVPEDLNANPILNENQDDFLIQ
jgi:hypothetical protein